MKRPSFQLYPLDWLGDPNVMVMTAEQEGAYIHILASMWTTEKCELKDDVNFLAKLARVDNSVITEIYHCFYSVNGFLRHKRLDKEREKQNAFRTEKSKAGKKGMASRWAKHNRAITSDNSSSSSSSSSSPSGETREGAEKKKVLFEGKYLTQKQIIEIQQKKYKTVSDKKSNDGEK